MTHALASTRRALHAVAEHVLAADLHRHTGKIGLRPTPGGFGTPAFMVDGATRQLRVDGTDLVLLHGDERRSAPLTTLRAAGDLVGTEPGGPADVYTLQTELSPDAALVVDAPAARLIADWFALAADAFSAFAPDTPAQLWPEHFDLAISVREANFGGSPGDAEHPEPYLYVGPWSPRTGPFWNEQFGASMPWREDRNSDDAVAFFERGQAEMTRNE